MAEQFQNEIIRALWWNQPFATLMLFGKVETRKRPTKVRGKVLICSCKEPYDLGQQMTIAGRRQYDRIAEMLNDGKELPFAENFLPCGVAIAIGELTLCYPMQDNKEMENQCFVQYKRGLWCWRFENVQAIQPFEIKGKQGWAILDEATKAKIKIIKPKEQKTQVMMEMYLRED
jgi:hypothetical protein